MALRPRLRRSLALAVVAVLALLLHTPVCSAKVCSMSKAKMAACEALGGDCCQAASTGAAHPSVPAQVQAPPPGPVAFANAANAANTANSAGSLARQRALREPLAAAAIVQGVGLHTLLAVFLI